MRLLGILMLCLIGHVYGGPSQACIDNEWELCDYVFRDDGCFTGDGNYVIEREHRWDDLDVTTYWLYFESQCWFDEEWTNQPVWSHYLMVSVPDSATLDLANALLYISGRSNPNGPPSETDDYTRRTAEYAQNTGLIGSVLNFIPNQPIVFTNDSRQAERYEDDLIAYTWVEYMDDFEDETPNPEVIARMPMVKGTVRAMDTLQYFVNTDLGAANVEEFMIVGLSKRGWTTWMTAPVDDRVVAMVPVVLSSLNMVENFHHYYQSFGGWPLYFWDYWNSGIMGRLDDPACADLERIADPFSYRDGFTMPTLIIQGASDEFFLIDDSHYFLSELDDDFTFLWLIEDTGHSIRNGPRYEDYWEALEGFYLGVIEGFEWPRFNWRLDLSEDRDNIGGIEVNVQGQYQPKEVIAYSALSVVPDRRDWRLSRRCEVGEGCGEIDTGIEWDPKAVEDRGNGQYYVDYEAPEEGYLAFYINLRFDGPQGRDLVFTSEVNILPFSFPYEDCQGRNCTGILK